MAKCVACGCAFGSLVEGCGCRGCGHAGRPAQSRVPRSATSVRPTPPQVQPTSPSVSPPAAPTRAGNRSGITSRHVGIAAAAVATVALSVAFPIIPVTIFVILLISAVVFKRVYPAWLTFQAVRPGSKVACPHCGTVGSVRYNHERVNTGISGGKATAAVLTGGTSVLFTGLSGHLRVSTAWCDHCKAQWTPNTP